MSLEDRLYQLLSEQKVLTQMIEAVYSEVILLQKAIDERRAARSFLEAYGDINLDEADTLLPIGGGIYVESRLPIKKVFYIHVGANIYLIKEYKEAIEYLDKSINELEKALNERNKTMNELKRKYDELSSEISEIYIKLQGKG